MKRRWWVVPLVLAAGGGAFFVANRGEAEGPPDDKALRVQVERADLKIEVVETGKVRPEERVEIKSKVAGQATEVLVEEGERVVKGQLLVRLDPTDHQREVARAQADVAQAENSLAFARLDLERKQRALKDRGVARIEVDLAENEVKARSIASKLARIALAVARDRLRYTEIVSPIDGTVLEVGIEAGEVVTPGVQQTFEGRPLMVVGDLSTLVVKSELNQIDIAKIEVGDLAELSFDALPGRRFSARVTKTAPAAVLPKGKTVEVFPVEATLTETSTTIRPGMTADVRFAIDTRRGVLSVPIEAVVRDKGDAFVTKIVSVEGKPRTERVAVRLGARSDRQVEVAEGIVEGDELLIDPASSKANEIAL